MYLMPKEDMTLELCVPLVIQSRISVRCHRLWRDKEAPLEVSNKAHFTGNKWLLLRAQQSPNSMEKRLARLACEASEPSLQPPLRGLQQVPMPVLCSCNT